ncbi:LysE family translocator [Metabacillus halosaccharovorans]|uniref:LysE family translocator n=1 Tax=Metabacillus halosaccharovorans TaxID=930124 RepID=UPI000995394D|nr:LysE family transporter [Metabacillus halosaccharovorans]
MSIVAFFSYVMITSLTPGPSNILMMNEARKFGFAGSWKFSAGILAGFAFLGIISGIFTTWIYKWIPVIEPYFKIAGAAYLCYLAWRIGFPKESAKNEMNEGQTSFFSGFIFQVINVKSILFFLTLMSTFILPFHQTIKSTGFYLSLSILLGWLALLLWAGFGSIFKKMFVRHDKVFRIIMCLLLVYSAVSIFL